jgi:DNA-binding PadR family transcriptional regulator
VSIHWERIFMGHSKHDRAGGDWREMFGGPTPRADRGAVRYLVLDAIAPQPRHGYEIIQFIEERSGGAYRPSPGAIYPTLQLLEELGHAVAQDQEGRKTYSITAEGLRDLGANQEVVEDFYERSGFESWEDHGEALHDLTKRVGKVFKAIGRSARRGRLTPTTMKKIRLVLDEALARIELLVDPERRL